VLLRRSDGSVLLWIRKRKRGGVGRGVRTYCAGCCACESLRNEARGIVASGIHEASPATAQLLQQGQQQLMIFLGEWVRDRR
jgi:hypothetical protein